LPEQQTDVLCAPDVAAGLAKYGRREAVEELQCSAALGKDALSEKTNQCAWSATLRYGADDVTPWCYVGEPIDKRYLDINFGGLNK
jgi:hypothetical protein